MFKYIQLIPILHDRYFYWTSKSLMSLTRLVNFSFTVLTTEFVTKSLALVFKDQMSYYFISINFEISSTFIYSHLPFLIPLFLVKFNEIVHRVCLKFSKWIFDLNRPAKSLKYVQRSSLGKRGRNGKENVLLQLRSIPW